MKTKKAVAILALVMVVLFLRGEPVVRQTVMGAPLGVIGVLIIDMAIKTPVSFD